MKQSLFLLAAIPFLVIVGCSQQKKPAEKQAPTTHSTEQIKKKQKATTPAILRGTWVGTNGAQDLKIIITNRAIITDGQTYPVTSYTQNQQTYTILWDTSTVKKNLNPQPFIYTYDTSKDTLTSGVVFHRN